MTERRTRLRGGRLLVHRDPSHSRDPQVRVLVRRLAQLPPGPAPSDHFRAELRAQLVAVAPRLVTEGVAADPPSRTAGARRPGVAPSTGTLLRRLASARVGRPVAAVLGVLCVFALLLGGAVWISGKAMPGDTLYTVKRATENARLALAGSDTEKARDYLSFAGTRAEEVADLLGQPTAAAAAGGSSAADGISAHTAKLVGSTLDSADGDVRDASQLLTAKAVRDRSTSPLSVMIAWAPGQLTRLQHIAARVPSGSVLERVRSSAQLVQAALTRAQQLQHGIGCSCLATAPSDQLGPVPCTSCTPGVPVQGPGGAQPPSGNATRQHAATYAPGATLTTGPAQHPGGTHSGPGTTHSTGGAHATHSPTTATSSRSAGASTPSTTTRSTPGAGGGAAADPAGGGSGSGSGSGSSGGGQAPGTPSSPQPSKTCLIVLLGFCL